MDQASPQKMGYIRNKSLFLKDVTFSQFEIRFKKFRNAFSLRTHKVHFLATRFFRFSYQYLLFFIVLFSIVSAEFVTLQRYICGEEAIESETWLELVGWANWAG